MKFIITVLKQILASFYFAQVKKIPPLPPPTPQTKVVSGEEVCKGVKIRKSSQFTAGGPHSAAHKDQEINNERRSSTFLANGWGSVIFYFSFKE
jgi:hypothetical protein